MAEASSQDADRARSIFLRAVEQYDAVLKVRPNSVEAVNNKAWILHAYLGENPKALELAEGLLKRARPGSLPGEFYDTLGSIQEAAGDDRAAEGSYETGLKKTPDHPVLHFHFGRLIAGDRARSNLARTHLSKALEARGQLNPAMAKEAEQLLRQIGDPTASNLN
jgi:tetratricopeptide (TPR) repeat protein